MATNSEATAARALAALDRGAFWAVTLVMGAMVGLVSIQVLLRYAFQNSIDWADDVSRLLFVASIFLAVPLGVKEGAHIGTENREERRHEEPNAQRQEDDHKDIADGRFIIGSQLTSKDSAEIPHALHPRIRLKGLCFSQGQKRFLKSGWKRV